MVTLEYVRAKAAKLGDGSASNATREFIGKLIEYGILAPIAVPQAPTPAPKYPDALVERMVVLVRDVAAHPMRGHATEARAILAELPAEVDAGLVEARELAASGIVTVYETRNLPDAIRNGEEDAVEVVQIALAAIKRGRALAEAGEGREKEAKDVR